MNDKVEELVEWVANKVVVYSCKGCEWEHKDAPRCNGESDPHELCEYQFSQAKQLLSHPDLALKVDCECNGKGYTEGGDGAPTYHVVCSKCCDTGKAVIPLAEALKQIGEV